MWRCSSAARHRLHPPHTPRHAFSAVLLWRPFSGEWASERCGQSDMCALLSAFGERLFTATGEAAARSPGVGDDGLATSASSGGGGNSGRGGVVTRCFAATTRVHCAPHPPPWFTNPPRPPTAPTVYPLCPSSAGPFRPSIRRRDRGLRGVRRAAGQGWRIRHPGTRPSLVAIAQTLSPRRMISSQPSRLGCHLRAFSLIS